MVSRHVDGLPLPLSVVGAAAAEAISACRTIFLGMTSPFLDSTDSEEMWEKFELPYRPEMLVNCGANLMMSIANKETVAASLAKYKFIVSFDLFLTETSDFADIVLPDCSYLQSMDSRSNFPSSSAIPPAWANGAGRFASRCFRPTASSGILPTYCSRSPTGRLPPDMLRRLSTPRSTSRRRIGCDVTSKYTYEQICDAELKNNFGDRARLRLVQGERRHQVAEEAAGGVLAPVHRRARADLLGVDAAARRKIAAIAEPRGLQDPARILSAAAGLPAVPRRMLPQAGFRFLRLLLPRHRAHQQLHHGECVARRGGPARSVLVPIAINTEAGTARRGSADGELVWVETESGRKVKGRVQLTECIHPEGMGIAALGGHWTDGMPVAKGKGVFFNDLLELIGLG